MNLAPLTSDSRAPQTPVSGQGRCGRKGQGGIARRSQNGFTIAELMVASGVSVFLLSSLFVSFIAISNSFDAIGKYTDMDKQDRNTLNLMVRDIRNTGHLTNWTSTSLQFTNQDGTLLTYTYQTNGTLTYTNGSTGGSGTLLSNCTSLSFNLFQRTPTNGPMCFYTTTNASLAKGILISFTCIKTNYLGVRASESGETTSVVMRN